MQFEIDKTQLSTMARRLTAFLNERPKGPFKHSHALEAVARMLGYPNHNTLSAKLAEEAGPGAGAPVEDRINHRLQQLAHSLSDLARPARGDTPSPSAALTAERPLELAGPAIKAEAHSDDRTVEATFDARPWFRQASDAEILALARSDWGRSYEADAVAEFCADQAGGEGVKRIFDYLSFNPRQLFANDPVGFECTVDAASAMTWLRAQRPQLADRLDRIAAGEDDFDSN